MIIGNVISERPVSLPPRNSFTDDAGVEVSIWSVLAQRGECSELTNYTPALAAGALLDYVATIGAVPVMLTRRLIQFDGLAIRLEVYKDPIYTGGVNLVSYNMNTGHSTPILSTLVGGVTVTNAGVKCSADVTLLGSTDVGIRVISTNLLTNTDVPRILKPNTKYLFRTVSVDTAPMRVSTQTQFFEGAGSSIIFD
jgi:hypothetical protein